MSIETLKYCKENPNFEQLNSAALGSPASHLLFMQEGYTITEAQLRTLCEKVEIFCDFAALNLRSLPYESEHYIDPVTLEANNVSFFGFLVEKELFLNIGAFDKSFFLDDEMSDLSYRLKSSGKKIYELADIEVVGGCEPLQTLELYIQKQLSPLFLSCKYGTVSAIAKAKMNYFATIKKPKHFEGVRKKLLLAFLQHISIMFSLYFFRYKNKQFFQSISIQQHKNFPKRGSAKVAQMQEQPLVSVVIRTVKRPLTLEKTLISLTHQTYKNFEVIIVEDGANSAKELIKRFCELNIVYEATAQAVGRSRAGNIGLAKAKGEYINFLDDDDYFFPDHIQLLCSFLQSHKTVDLVLAGSFAMEADIVSSEPYILDVKNIRPIIFERLDIFDMCFESKIPIQSVMFKKELYIAKGGLREDFEGNEDWSMWLRFLSIAKRDNCFGVDIKRATSMFLVPHDRASAKKRRERYKAYNKQLLEDDELVYTFTAQQLKEQYKYIMADVMHLYGNGELERYINNINKN